VNTDFKFGAHIDHSKSQSSCNKLVSERSVVTSGDPY